MTTIFSPDNWNNIFTDEAFNYDDIFRSSSDDIRQDFIINTEQNKTPSFSPEFDLPALQTSATDSSQTELLQSNLVCSVCSAPAHGYNFDQITCESCKAFFRRNALRQMPDLKCRFSGSCVINIRTRRQCTYCRLKKCFDIKMRKDWIRTDEETKLRQLQALIKQQTKLNKLTSNSQPVTNLPIVVRKKKRLMIKSNPIVNPIFTQTYFGFNRNLCDEDQILLNNITNAYQLGANLASGFRVCKYSESTTLIQFIDKENTIHRSLIEFYKGIPEFKRLDINDQVGLIKSNLLNLVHVHDILIQNFEEDPMIGVFMTVWFDEAFHHQMSRTRRNLYRFIEHPLVLKLALLVFIFSIYECENDRNQINVEKIQEFYATLLWRYLNYLFGETEAIRSMEIITRQMLHFQSLMNIMEEAVKQKGQENISDELMKSIFRLT